MAKRQASVELEVAREAEEEPNHYDVLPIQDAAIPALRIEAEQLISKPPQPKLLTDMKHQAW